MKEPTTSRMALWVLIGAGGAGVVLSWFVAGHSLIGARWTFLVMVAGWGVLWVIGARAASLVATRTALWVIVVLAVALRLAAATGTTPSVSDDSYRYAWDAHVQLSGTDPYRYPPSAPQVSHLRTPGFWPSPARCAHINEHPGCTVLNRPGVRTIYPPVAEAWFVVIHVLTPGDAGSRPWQLAGGLVDDATVILIVMALRDKGRDPRQAVWYALSPLPVLEFAGNGHVDGLALLLLGAAILALRRERRGLAGILVGLATMVKLYPGLALVAGWRRGRWRFVMAAVGVVLAAEVPHLLAVGPKILGYLPGYLREEHYANGGRFLLLGLLGLPGRLTTALAAAVLIAGIIAVLRARLEPDVGLVTLLTLLVFVTTPVQPWYAVAVAGVGAFIAAPWLLVVAAAVEPYYAVVVLNDPQQLSVGRAGYAASALVVSAVLIARRLRGPAQPSIPMAGVPTAGLAFRPAPPAPRTRPATHPARSVGVANRALGGPGWCP